MTGGDGEAAVPGEKGGGGGGDGDGGADGGSAGLAGCGGDGGSGGVGGGLTIANTPYGAFRSVGGVVSVTVSIKCIV